ncbi:MAG: NUDIX hydrolase [Alistipes sp.]|nr:NUDIX hydrolase [Alistipes senegalensis]MCM1250947.1 NUDIX hydrolase [Alistipes sp.]
MEHTVYFADKSVSFVSEPFRGGASVFVPDGIGAISRDKIMKFLETDNSVAVVAADPDAAFARFAEDFTRVEAAGGVVANSRGERLMIRRNGRWDLPKGHLEPGESIEQCAAREIAEETGVRAEVAAPLCTTWHAYWFPKTERWELKRTRWFLLRALGDDPLAPQTEEGIDEVVWCSPVDFTAHLQEAFPTVQRVGEALLCNEESRRSLPSLNRKILNS